MKKTLKNSKKRTLKYNMFNQYKKTFVELKNEVKEKDLFLKAFYHSRKCVRQVIDDFKNIRGNTKCVSDALILSWTETAILFHSGLNKEYTHEISNFLATLLGIVDYKTKEEKEEFQNIYIFLIDCRIIRGFKLNDDITSIIKEEWFRNPIIKTTDYLLFPDCIDSYENYVADVDEDDETQWELFDHLTELVSIMNEYFDVVRLMILNKRI